MKPKVSHPSGGRGSKCSTSPWSRMPAKSHTPAGQAAAAASGDAGARPFLRSHPELIDPVYCTHLSYGADVDQLLPLD